MRDLRVEVRFRNNYLYRAIYDRYESIAQFCRENDLTLATVYDYINFKSSPVSTRSPKTPDGKVALETVIFKDSAIKISKVLNHSTICIFPEQLWNVTGKNYSAEIDIPPQDLIPYTENLMITDNAEHDKYDYSELPRVLSVLKPREEAILRKSFGIGCPRMSYRDIGEDLGITGCRVSQVGAKALRKLRHPTLRNKLRKNGRCYEIEQLIKESKS